MKKIVLLLFGLSLCAGCGYRTGSLMSDSSIKTIFVENFKNNTFDVKLTRVNKIASLGIETKLTDEIVRRFMLDGTLRVVPKRDADVILSGDIKSYSLSPRSFDQTDIRLVAQYGIGLSVSVTLREAESGDVLWVDDLSKGASYFVTGSLARSEEDAVGDATAELARDIVIRTVEGW